MRELIDLYAKLVIGTFSFIGPSFTLLIPLFYQAFDKSRNKHNAMLKNLQLAIAENIGLSEDPTGAIEASTKKLKKLKRDNKKELNLLKPKRQVRRLFISLFISLILIGFYYFQHCHFWNYNNVWLKSFSIIISGFSFVYCLRVLWQVFCTIIRIKSEEERKPLFLRKKS